jgi:benzoate membrane transport protein
VVYSIAALFAGIFSTLFGTFPVELTSILAGLALLPVISNALSDSLEKRDFKDAAVIKFFVTASGISAFGVGAPFWGLLAGLLINQLNVIRVRLHRR